SKQAMDAASPNTIPFCFFSRSRARQGYPSGAFASNLEYTFSAFICAMVKGVNGASLPPTKNLSAIPLSSQATPLVRECKAVEQVMEWDISGPWACRSWATQEDIFPKVVVGEDKVEASPFWINSL